MGPFYYDTRPLGAATNTTTEVRFTDAQMRITRLATPAGQTAEIAPTAVAPALPLKAGQERWVASSRRERLANVGASQIELLRIDVMTPPDGA